VPYLDVQGCTDRALLHGDGGNDRPGLRHPGSVQSRPDHHCRRRTVSVLDASRHPVPDVLNLDTTPATTCEDGPLAADSRLCSRPQNHEAMVYWAAVFIMTRRLTRYENRENLAEGVGFELGHRSRQARALNKKDQANRLSSISSILLNRPRLGAKCGHEVP